MGPCNLIQRIYQSDGDPDHVKQDSAMSLESYQKPRRDQLDEVLRLFVIIPSTCYHLKLEEEAGNPYPLHINRRELIAEALQGVPQEEILPLPPCENSCTACDNLPAPLFQPETKRWYCLSLENKPSMWQRFDCIVDTTVFRNMHSVYFFG